MEYKKCCLNKKNAYVFLVELDDWQDVSGKIEIGGNESLVELHLAIQDLFNWDNDHLYSFFMDNKYWGKGEQYSTFGNEEEFLPSSYEGKANAKKISALKIDIGSKFKYIFDYGDEWRCQIKLIEIIKGESRKYRIIDRHGTPPLQYQDYED